MTRRGRELGAVAGHFPAGVGVSVTLGRAKTNSRKHFLGDVMVMGLANI